MINQFLIVALGLFFICEGTEHENARLLASKSVLNSLLVQDKDLTVQYDIYNIGSSTAFEVQLKESSFIESDFEIIHGSPSVKWSRIGSGVNVSHVLIVRPKFSGYFNFTAAEIIYMPSETSSEIQLAYTSAPGEGGILNYKEYDRKFSSHVLDWAAFAVMTLPSLLIPYVLWHGSQSKYEVSRAKKN